MLQDLVNLNLFAFFLIFARVGAAFLLLPGYSAAYVSPNIRLALALAVSFAVMPLLADTLPAPPSAPSAFALLLVGETVIGSFFGILARILLGALQTAGTMIALFASLANAFVQDPVGGPIAEQQSSTVSGFLTTLGIVVIFATNLHELMLKAVVDSYMLFTPGQPLVIGDLSDTVARQVADSFALGLQLAAPFLVVALTYYVGLGILGRLMPTLQVFFFGLPVQIALQIWVMMIAVSGIMMVFMTRFQDSFVPFLGQ
jgi:flagellar biosynthetic protein FliR